jgi:pimeloyl-ACP methyl ester carboxylesterase
MATPLSFPENRIASSCLLRPLQMPGIASVRYDKRSVGKSAAARLPTNTFDQQVDDAAAWVDWIARDKRFRAVGIVGHSEGSIIGALAAQRGGVALVSLVGGGHPFAEITTRQMERGMKAGQISKEAYASIKAAFAELAAGRTVTTRPPNIPDILWTGIFQPRAQEYLISLFRYDPVTEFAKLPAKGVKVLVVAGTNDLTGDDGDADLLAAAVGVKAYKIEGMGHELKLAPPDPKGNDKASQDPHVPLAPELVKIMVPFLNNALK